MNNPIIGAAGMIGRKLVHVLFEALRRAGLERPCRPRVVFTTSIVVFGEPLPRIISDSHCLTPLTSYSAQKATGDLLLADYSRKGVLYGIGIRLPSISIRPKRAKTLGFRGETSFEEIIRVHIADALENHIPEYA